MPLEAEEHPRARLTRDLVIEMRQRVKAGETVEAVIAGAGVAWSTGYRAIVGHSWQSVDAVEAPVSIRRHRWTEADDAALTRLGDERAPFVAEQLGRTPAAINIRRSRRDV